MGRAHALLLAQRGAKVVVNDLGVSMGGEGASSGPAEEVAAEIRAAGGSAVADINDVSTEQGANAMVQTAIDAFGRLDVVVHNAGTVTFIPFPEMTYEQYRKLVAVHQDGGFLVAKAAWPHMVQQSYGRLIFISSLASMATLAHYASAKAAVTGFVRTLAAEGQSHGIRANALSVIAFTRLMEGYFHKDSGHYDMGLFGQVDIENWWRDNLRPEQISQVVGWLGHESCPISGETLMSGGGFVTRQFVGFTDGYANADLTPELVAANAEAVLHLNGAQAYGAPGADFWTFQRMVEGGAPPLPTPRPLGPGGGR
jgi:NAD(P)-dependent dehydrogenase (short-subunit alcohol dehydrogenase family)